MTLYGLANLYATDILARGVANNLTATQLLTIAEAHVAKGAILIGANLRDDEVVAICLELAEAT